ncbi:FGGY-family carbohydrate kinase [Feifania hominis]|uniref:FGGY-family carbohydrate kinase n=1 Tax=Feifania hominis TaxID=2763660 RepID=A0A926HUP4_9FIRM|nr:FGGY-family carbohydrate kinase [Feifania hominis]MBC8535776.1 FGGY-family carbohydrate kinase [Feifania hominis]
MGIDIGTYESKGVLSDDCGNIVAKHVAKHELLTPKPGWCEHDAERDWWGDLCTISKNLIEKSGVSPNQIEALGCSTAATCCVPVDRELKPLRNAILYGVDTRTAKEIEYVKSLFDEKEFIARYHNPITTQSFVPKVLWIKNNEPEVYEKTYKFLLGTSFLVARLTGNFVADRYSLAAFVPVYDIEKGDYDDAYMGLCCRRDQLPDPMWTTEIGGRVTAEAAKATGLAEGTPVIVGTADASAEAFSTGVIDPGDMMLMYGSSIFLIDVVDRLCDDARLYAGNYFFPDTYVIKGGMSTSGTITRWFRDKFYTDALEKERQTGRNAYDIMLDDIDAIPAGSDGLITLPYFSGERTPINDPNATGMMFGLTLNHTRAHMYRSALEGVGYGIAQHFDIIRSMGQEPKNVYAVGGGTKSLSWMQLITDIANVPQIIREVTIGASFGDTLLAALAVGRYKNTAELKKLLTPGKALVPDPVAHEAYQPYRQIYNDLYPATKQLMHELKK